MVRVPRIVPWLALALLGAVVAWPRGAAAQEAPPTPQLSVSGQGTVSVRPDVAIVAMGAAVRRDNAQEAFDQANALAGSLTQFLRGQGVAERDITTRQFNLSPEFGRQEGDAPRPIVAWRAANLLSVKIRDFSTIGATIDGAIRILGSDAQLSGISFTIEDTDTVARQARDEAIANAKQRAEQMAEAAGVRLVRILSITETSAPPPRPVPVAAAPAVADRSVAAEVAPGEQNITVTVEIVYEIG
ncbi:MAG: SIMPL domain-containing protein [Dehalococcoidia bacterium]